MVGNEYTDEERVKFIEIFESMIGKGHYSAAHENVFTLTVFRNLTATSYIPHEYFEITGIKGGTLYENTAAQGRLTTTNNIKLT